MTGEEYKAEYGHCDDAHMEEWRTAVLRDPKHPFRFEDLLGKPEPASWGPCYPKTASAAVQKWRVTSNGRVLSDEEKRAYGADVHKWIRSLNAPQKRTGIPDSDLHYRYSGAKRRASIIAALHSGVEAERRRKLTPKDEDAIRNAYALAMAEKRKRLAAQPKPKPRLTYAQAMALIAVERALAA